MSISGVPELLLRKEHTSAGHPCRGGGTCDSVSWFCFTQRDIGARRLATNVTTVSSNTHFLGEAAKGDKGKWVVGGRCTPWMDPQGPYPTEAAGAPTPFRGDKCPQF
jgi:hypothetical protein